MFKGKTSNSSGITLIALVVTVIVLLILAGVAIAMLRGDNGILNRATETKNTSILGEFDEQVKLGAMAVKTKIEAKKASTPGYIATAKENGEEKNLKSLADDVASGLGVTAVKGQASNGNIETEGYTVAYYLDSEGSSTQNGNGYIVIWFTNNSLRSSIDMEKLEEYKLALVSSLDSVPAQNKAKTKNQAVLVAVIQVENYNYKLSSNYGLTSIADANEDIRVANYGDTSVSSSNGIEIVSDVVSPQDRSDLHVGDYIKYVPGGNRTYAKSNANTQYLNTEYTGYATWNLERKFICPCRSKSNSRIYNMENIKYRRKQSRYNPCI